MRTKNLQHGHRNKLKLSLAILAGAMSVLAPGAARAQASGDRIAVPLSDATRPVTVKAHLVNGGITVKGYEGKDVIVEARTRAGESGNEGNMRRIPITTTGLTVEEDGNVVVINTESHRRPTDLTISVPYKTSLNLHTVNDGNIVVTGVEGELEVNAVNGSVTLKDVSGSAIAHALNGKVLVNFVRISQKPMAFSSLNGDIDLTFPSELKATLSMSSDRGEVYSDFDVQLQANAPKQTVEDSRGQGGRYRVRIEKTIRGTINGGGQEIQFKNFNGNIYIRKKGQ